MVQSLSFVELREKILDESGKPREKYIGQEDYALFAKDHYDGDMQEGFYECFISIGWSCQYEKFGFGLEMFFWDCL